MRSDEIEARLRANPLFRDASPERVALFARETSVRHFEDGEAIWQLGEPATHFMILQRGLVQVLRRLPSGEAATLGIFGPRESLGTVAVLGRRPYPAEAIAYGDDVEVLSLRAEPVLLAMNDDPGLALAFNRALCEQTTMLRSRIDVLSAGSVPQRLATLLLHLAERFGDSVDEKTSRIPLSLSRTALARLVSARVETVIRAASDWQKRGLLSTDATGFEVHDLAELQRIANEG